MAALFAAADADHELRVDLSAPFHRRLHQRADAGRTIGFSLASSRYRFFAISKSGAKTDRRERSRHGRQLSEDAVDVASTIFLSFHSRCLFMMSTTSSGSSVIEI